MHNVRPWIRIPHASPMAWVYGPAAAEDYDAADGIAVTDLLEAGRGTALVQRELRHGVLWSQADASLERVVSRLGRLLAFEARRVDARAAIAARPDSDARNGWTRLQRASLRILGGEPIALEERPAPNTPVLPDRLGPLGIRLLLNEQIAVAGPEAERGMAVRAVHLTLDRVPVEDASGRVSLLTGEIAIGCSDAWLEEPAPAEPRYAPPLFALGGAPLLNR